jgi:hypothetical protein
MNLIPPKTEQETARIEVESLLPKLTKEERDVLKHANKPKNKFQQIPL